MTTLCHVVLKFTIAVRKKMIENTMFVSHSPLEKRIVIVLDRITHTHIAGDVFSSQILARIPRRMKASTC